MRNQFFENGFSALEVFQNDVLEQMLRSGALTEMPIVNEVDLILEAELTSKDNVVKFTMVQGASNDRKTEFKITKNDLFCMSHGLLGVMKYKRDGNSDYPVSPLATYADKAIFAGVKGGKEVDAIRSIWDGFLSFRTSRTERLADFHTRNFMLAPQRQFSDGVEASYGVTHEERGYYKFAQCHILSGGSTNKIELALPDMNDRSLLVGGFNDKGVAIVGEYNVVRLQLKGHVAIDAATAYDNWLKKA